MTNYVVGDIALVHRYSSSDDDDGDDLTFNVAFVPVSSSDDVLTSNRSFP